MEMIGKVRRMKLRDKLSNSAIAKLTGLSRNTVKKWLKAPGAVIPKYSRESPAGKLTAFEATLDQSLKADSHRPKHARRTAKALLTQIQAQGYLGGYSAVTDFVRAWREKTATSPAKAFVPLNFELGEAFQFDWSDEGLMVGGVFYKVQVAHLKLCASRAFWLVAYPSQGHEMLFDAHTRSFQALGGVTRRGIYDNMKTAVDKVKKGKGPNARDLLDRLHLPIIPDHGAQPLADVLDVILHAINAFELLLNADHQFGRQQVSQLCLGQLALDRLEKFVVPNRQCNAKLAQYAAQRIGLHDAHLHELAAHPVQRQTCLLTLGFDGYRLDMWLLGGHPDRLRIHGIGLVTQQEGLDMLGREHFDLMP